VLLKILTLPFDITEGCFDDTALLEFTSQHQVLAASDHLLVVAGEPYWAILLQARPLPGAKPPSKRAKAARVDLEPAERALYDHLRAWRTVRAQADGVPPYVLFNNAQLAALAKRRPASLDELREIPGVGEKKSARYGEDLLEVIRGAGDQP